MKRFLWISVLMALSISLHAQQKIFGVTREGGISGGGTLYVTDTTGQNYKVLRNFGQPEHSPDNNEVIEGPDGLLYGTVAKGGMYNAGAIFKINKNGSGYTTLHYFNSVDARNPSGHLALAAGYLYGTTREGGDNNLGIIFKIKTDGTDYGILFSFSTESGNTPQSGLLLGADGRLYGTTQEGGSTQQGTIFSINTNGTGFTTLHNFDVEQGALPYGGLYQDSNNVLYGIAATRETTSKGFIYSINPDGSNYTNVYTFGIDADPRSTLIQLNDGYLYGLTSYFIFRIKPDGTEFQNLRTFDGFTGRTGVGKLVLAGNGYLYGVTAAGGGFFDEGVIFRIKPDGTDYQVMSEFSSNGQDPTGNILLSGTAIYGMTNQGGAGFSGVLYKHDINNAQTTTLRDFFTADPMGQRPVHIITGPDNILYGVTEEGGTGYNGAIFKVNTDGSNYTTIYNFALREQDGAKPNGLIYASNGYLYGTTAVGGTGNDNGTLFRLKPDGSAFETLQSWGGSDGAKPTGGLVEWNNEIWIVTEEGGAEDAGTIQAIPLANTNLHTIYNFIPSNTTDGNHPTGRLLAASDGYLYGLTRAGGTNDRGTLFRVTSTSPTAKPQTLFNFSIFEGNRPTGSLVETPDGMLNGMSTDGALIGYGELFKIKKDGTAYTSLYPFSNPPEAEAVDHLIVNSTGSLFGVTSGGLNGYGMLFATDVNGTNAANILNFTFTTGSSPMAITLSGATTNPELDVVIDNAAIANNGKKDFGTITVLSTTDPATVTLKNTGASNLVFNGNPKVVVSGATTDFVIDQSTLPATIAAGGTATFTITFKPQTVGSKTAALRIATNDADEGSFNINLTGSAIKQGQTISFTAPTPKTYGAADFTLQATSTAGLSITFTSANPAIATINGNTVTIKKAGSVEITAAQPGNDNVTAATAVKHTLVINKATQNITFAALPNKSKSDAPFTLNATASSNLAVSYTSSNKAVATVSGNTVTIVGVGQTNITAAQAGNENYLAAATVQQPLTITAQAVSMQVTPTALDFGDIVLGESANKTFSINNTGEATLEITSITLPTGFTINSTGANISLAKGTGVTLTLTFKPENATTYNGEITLQTNATNGPHTITLTGKGVPVTGINDPAIPQPKIYPNPGTGVYTITTTQKLTSENTQLISSNGTIIRATLMATEANIYTVDLSNNPAGVYLLLFQTGNNTQTYRIIKQ